MKIPLWAKVMGLGWLGGEVLGFCLSWPINLVLALGFFLPFGALACKWGMAE